MERFLFLVKRGSEQDLSVVVLVLVGWKSVDIEELISRVVVGVEELISGLVVGVRVLTPRLLLNIKPHLHNLPVCTGPFD